MKRHYLFTTITLLCLILSTTQSVKAECQYNEVVQAVQFQIGIMLTWSTHAEIDHERFIIEKSENGIDFSEIGTVTGSGTTENLKEYNFLHIYPSESRIYYRLREIDFSGVISYSDIVIFENKEPLFVHVVRLSNAFTSKEFSVKLDSYTEGELQYNLKNWQGEQLDSQELTLTNGLNDISIDVKDLPVGIYKLDLVLNDNVIDVLTFKRVEKEGEDKAPMVRKD
ncbi:MAG: hypothetical protein ACI85O_000066 [Saprospiraceae bacterium]|jgi:hypothetical protein